MFSWLRRRRETAERVDAEADALIGEFSVGAYAEARRREYEASGYAIALWWNQVALAVGRKSGKLVGLDTSTRMAMNVAFAPDREQTGVCGCWARALFGRCLKRDPARQWRGAQASCFVILVTLVRPSNASDIALSISAVGRAGGDRGQFGDAQWRRPLAGPLASRRRSSRVRAASASCPR
jgi:hypothetical protein